ncbi:hypothetical protein [Mycobacterium sp.]|uniref:hypothetical protein n=1 Tax=Mycobacterium sp. TaxID=1785 RepID=UPI003F9AC2B7
MAALHHPERIVSFNMTPSTAAAPIFDPASRSPGSWGSSVAALRSRGVSDDDPRMIQARQALSWWRFKRTVDAEVKNGLFDRGFADAILAAVIKYPDSLDVTE